MYFNFLFKRTRYPFSEPFFAFEKRKLSLKVSMMNECIDKLDKLVSWIYLFINN